MLRIRFSRSNFSRTIAAAASAAALSFALAPAGAAHAKDLVVALSAAFTTLDPYDSPDMMTKTAGRSIYEGLFRFDENMNPVPDLAESYERSADGLVYTIKLKTGVKFHDGTTLDAAAVKKNFDRVLDPANHLTRRAVYSFIDRIDVVDPLTVRFTLKFAHGGFLRRLAMSNAMMICPSYIDKYNKGKQLAFHACGTGPYVQESFNPSERLVVKKNPNYRIPGLPKLSRITFLPVMENATRAAMLRTGEADFITTVPLEQMDVLKKDPNIVVQAKPSIVQKHLDLNNHFKPFNDVRVRQAVNYAIDKAALAKVAYGGYAVPQYGLLAETYPGAKKFGPWPYDPQKARELLKDAGYPDGFETTLYSGYNDTTASKVVQFIAQSLRQVGIRAKTKLLEPGVRSDLILNVKGPDDAKHRMFYIGWTDGTFDPDQILRPLLHSRQAPPVYMNTAYYANPEFDRLIDAALVESDQAKRDELYGKAQEIAWNDAPWAFLLFEMSTGAGRKELKNFVMRADQTFDYRFAEWTESDAEKK